MTIRERVLNVIMGPEQQNSAENLDLRPRMETVLKGLFHENKECGGGLGVRLGGVIVGESAEFSVNDSTAFVLSTPLLESDRVRYRRHYNTVNFLVITLDGYKLFRERGVLAGTQGETVQKMRRSEDSHGYNIGDNGGSVYFGNRRYDLENINETNQELMEQILRLNYDKVPEMKQEERERREEEARLRVEGHEKLVRANLDLAQKTEEMFGNSSP